METPGTSASRMSEYDQHASVMGMTVDGRPTLADGMFIRSTGDGEDPAEFLDDPDDPSRLYALMERALQSLEQANTSLRLSTEEGQQASAPGGGGDGGSERRSGYVMASAEAARVKDVLEETWGAVREWILSHPSVEERHAAATYQGPFSATALHVIFKLPDPPDDVVQALIDCSPDTVSWPDTNGLIPLHYACAHWNTGDILKILIDAYPESKTVQDRRMRTPLHYIFFSRTASSAFSESVNSEEDQEANKEGRIGHYLPDIVTLLSDTGAARQADEANGMLPLHYACAYGTSPAVLERLIDAYPESVVARANKGRTPFHFAISNAHRSASLDVLRFLLAARGDDIVDMPDQEGQLPLHMLSNVCRGIRSDQKEAQTNANECLQLYLNAKPRATADFLTAVQNLPEWLRDNAVVNSHVQEILNNKIAKRFPTSILLLDGYMLLMIIACFELASIAHIDYRFKENAERPSSNMITVWGVFIGGMYFLARELVQMFALYTLGTFRSWLTDSTNWLDMLLISLVFYFWSHMYYDLPGFYKDSKDNEYFRDGVAFTKGVLWLSVIIFLKSTMVDFAVFVEGVFYVVQRLVAFLGALGVILLAFAQMFVIVYARTNECKGNTYENGDPEFPHCRFWDSFLKVYTMLMGEVGDETRYENSVVAQVLYVSFAFLVVILLSNVLIAIVTDNYGVIKNDRAATVFWNNRLDFVAEMDAIAAVRKNFWCRPSGNRRRSPGGDELEAPPEGELPDAGGDLPGGAGFTDEPNASSVGIGYEKAEKQRMREAWKSVMGLFDSNLYDEIDVHPGSLEFWCYFWLRLFSVFCVIPLWLFLGVLTVGWLWPPQVREWLFVQRETPVSRADLANQALMEIHSLRAEVKSLHSEIKGEMKVDRREVTQIKSEVDTAQSEVMSDLQQVKELMSTLLSLSRQQRQL